MDYLMPKEMLQNSPDYYQKTQLTIIQNLKAMSHKKYKPKLIDCFSKDRSPYSSRNESIYPQQCSQTSLFHQESSLMVEKLIVDDNFRLRGKLADYQQKAKLVNQAMKKCTRKFINQLKFHRMPPQADRAIENFLIELLQQTEVLTGIESSSLDKENFSPLNNCQPITEQSLGDTLSTIRNENQGCPGHIKESHIKKSKLSTTDSLISQQDMLQGIQDREVTPISLSSEFAMDYSQVLSRRKIFSKD